MLLIGKENPYLSKGENLAESAAECLNSSLNMFKNHKILLLLSGGSSLELLNNVDARLVGANVTIAPLDERYSLKSSENNMAQIAQTEFFGKAKKNGVNIIDTRVNEGENQSDLAKRFNRDFNGWFSQNPEGKVIATVGIGPDGHVSGIMPYPEDPEKFKMTFDDGNPQHLVEGYDAGDKNPYPLRVTTTMNLLRRIDAAIVYAVGDNKGEAVDKVLAKEGDLASTPARILREIIGKVYLFTDQIR